VRTDCPIAKVLRKPEFAGRMVVWSIELSEFGIKYEPRGKIKAQFLADFIIELPTTPFEEETWILYIYGSSNKKGSETGIVLEGSRHFQLELALRFDFNTFNNKAKYEALIAGLLLARDMGVVKVICRSDSQLTVKHIRGGYQVKDPLLLQYYHKVLNIMQKFNKAKIEHIPKEQNSRADSLSKLASQRRQTQHNSIIQQIMNSLAVAVERCLTTTTKDDWIKMYKEVIKNQKQGVKSDIIIARKAVKFVMIGDDLDEIGHSTPLLKCLSQEQIEYIL